MINFVRKMTRVLVLSVSTTLLLASFAFAASAKQAIGVGATTGSSLRLREAPSTSAPIVATLSKGVAVAILDDNTNGWYQISYNGKSGYVSSDYVVPDRDNRFASYGRTNGDGINVRAAASTNSAVQATLPTAGTIVTVNGFQNGWYHVTCEYGTEGYIRSDFLDLTSSASSSKGSSKSSSAAIAETALQHKGTPYVWGGASAGGFDCSGFTMYVYGQHGHSLPHSATAQWQSGIGDKVYSIGALQPGDLVFFNDPSRNAGKACSHAGIYIGNGQHVHASSSGHGVVISDMNSGYYNRYFVGGIHV